MARSGSGLCESSGRVRSGVGNYLPTTDQNLPHDSHKPVPIWPRWREVAVNLNLTLSIPKCLVRLLSFGAESVVFQVAIQKRVALIMLIIALQFDVSTSKKKKRVALIMLIIALMN